jgi:hypothetical protein
MPDRLEKAKREKQEKERKMRGRKKEKSVYWSEACTKKTAIQFSR